MDQDRLERALADIARNLPLLAGACAPIGGIAEALVLLAAATNEMVEHIEEFRAAVGEMTGGEGRSDA